VVQNIVMNKTHQVIINSVVQWFEKAVLGLNLCPFAAKPYRQNAIRFELSTADSDESCLSDLFIQLDRLERHPEIETLVIICAQHLSDFDDYNQFLQLVDQLLVQEGWEGVYQVASFHPDYCFADCEPDDRANWTNRSPYPLLHLIREESITRAVNSHPDCDAIPERNIQKINELSDAQMKQIFEGFGKPPPG